MGRPDALKTRKLWGSDPSSPIEGMSFNHLTHQALLKRKVKSIIDIMCPLSLVIRGMDNSYSTRYSAEHLARGLHLSAEICFLPPSLLLNAAYSNQTMHMEHAY